MTTFGNKVPQVPPTKSLSCPLTLKAHALLDAICIKEGMRRTQCLEQMIREKARQIGVEVR